MGESLEVWQSPFASSICSFQAYCPVAHLTTYRSLILLAKNYRTLLDKFKKSNFVENQHREHAWLVQVLAKLIKPTKSNPSSKGFLLLLSW